jgi:xanthine dehydrogenase D subunit
MKPVDAPGLPLAPPAPAVPAAPGPSPGPSPGTVGDRLPRSDGRAKVTGAFAYSSDLHVDGVLFGATLRSPHASALIRSIDTSAARALAGVRAVLTHEDVPGSKLVGSVLPDQPVLAFDRVRHHGEPVAIVAADDPATAHRAVQLIVVDYAPLTPVTDVRAALAPDAEPLHEGGNELRTITILHGDPDATGDVVVRGSYEVGTQDQAFLGPESGLALPDGRGGVELHIATQWLHVDRAQIAEGLGLAPEQVTLVLAGVGGAFGAREDLSMQLHACLLALATQRPVKMAYSRDESFLGHVHRHPAWMEYEHHATRDGRLVAVRARLWLDGGAYASSSPAVIMNATTVAAGPYAVPNARLVGTVGYTNNPPNGAMRGFGAVQVAVGYEAQMDRLAAELGMDPVQLRIANALREGDVLPFGQRVRGPVAVPQLLAALRDLEEPEARQDDRARPGGPFGATRGESVVRGLGYAAGYKNIAFSEGFDDPATAHVRLALVDGAVRAEVHTAASEVGQGVIGVQEQIARTELGVSDVLVRRADTAIASAGSASASRLSWMVGGAVHDACVAVRALVLARAVARLGGETLAEDLALAGGAVVRAQEPGEPLCALADLLEHGPVEAERTYRHAPTHPLNPDTGQGDAHAGFAFVAHRAVVEVDVELGMARVVELACAQDVGRAINPLALEGQLDGASIQGLGLALSEELLIESGIVANRSFGSYRIPTMVDAPRTRNLVFELADPATPYGLRGVGELPSISSTPAVAAALRAATGRPLTRVPIRPDDLV